MHIAARSVRRVILVILSAILVPAAWAADARPRLQVDDYVIQAVVTPSTHQLKAVARVKFTALEDITIATFTLHNGLKPTLVLDATGQSLSAERVSQDATVRISLPGTLSKGSSTTLTFEYEGTVQSADDSPVPGLKLAYIGDPITYLLYAGGWFPMSGYGTDRFTAAIGVSVPAGYSVIGSGKEIPGEFPALPMEAAPAAAGKKGAAARATAGKLASPAGNKIYTFTYDKPSFPGTIFIGKYEQTKSSEGGLDVTVYTSAANKPVAQQYADTAAKEYFFYTTIFGPAYSNKLNVVELPNDTVPSAWAPEIAAIAGRAFSQKVNYRLLANTVAHQWWGTMVSPAKRDDWWLNDGFARYSEALYVEHAAGSAAFDEVSKDMAVGALAYETVPLSQVGKLDTFSPEFQSLVTDKGAAILNMLRWVIGDQAFDKTMHDFVAQYSGKPVTVSDFRKIAEQNSRPAVDLVLHPMARFYRRPRVQDQVHHLPHPERLSRGRRDPAGHGPLPHAG